MILEMFTSGPCETNVYVLGCPETKEACIIDAPLGCSEFVLEALKRHGLTVQKILLTHSHLDHMAEASRLKSLTQAPIAVHALDAKNVEQPGQDGLPLFMPAEAVIPDLFLKEGDCIQVGHLQIQVLETPGHTPGGVSFYLPREGVLFSGDTLFQGTMGRIDFPHSQPSKMWNSLKRLSNLPPHTRVFPGHGPSTTIGTEGWIRQAEERFS